MHSLQQALHCDGQLALQYRTNAFTETTMKHSTCVCGNKTAQRRLLTTASQQSITETLHETSMPVEIVKLSCTQCIAKLLHCAQALTGPSVHLPEVPVEGGLGFGCALVLFVASVYK